jgi:hypothetical protein
MDCFLPVHEVDGHSWVTFLGSPLLARWVRWLRPLPSLTLFYDEDGVRMFSAQAVEQLERCRG